MEHDQQAFWKLAYDQHGPALMAFLRSRTGSREDAEELLQETFVRAIRSSVMLRDRSKARGYLFTIAHNLLRSSRRRSRISPVVAVESPPDHEADEVADDRVRMRAVLERLGQVLAEMPAAHRRAFELAVVDKTPYRDICECTGWSLAQVKINVYRGRKRVTQALADLLPRNLEGMA
jgi:RNA polymerase sigma-70 factor (ECF subfamily)